MYWVVDSVDQVIPLHRPKQTVQDTGYTVNVLKLLVKFIWDFLRVAKHVRYYRSGRILVSVDSRGLNVRRQQFVASESFLFVSLGSGIDCEIYLFFFFIIL